MDQTEWTTFLTQGVGDEGKLQQERCFSSQEIASLNLIHIP
jgi:hypothetical protein